MVKISKKVSTVAGEILQYKKEYDANIVAILWKEPELFFQYNTLSIKNFTENCWKVFFAIGHSIIVKENKKALDDITVGMYLDKHPKLKQKFDEYGGLQTIEYAMESVSPENIDGYIKGSNKWKIVANLLAKGFPVAGRLKEFADMSASEIYEEYEAFLNHIFTDVEYGEVIHDMCEGLHELVDELDAGLNVGMPLKNLPILTAETGGNLIGNITMCLANTGVGKSSFTRNVLIPSILDAGESMVFFINEEDEKKLKSEVMVYIANNILLKDTGETLKKYVVRQGKYSDEVKVILHRAAEYMEQYKDRIKIITFKDYSASKVIKYIKKFSALGYYYFCLDTFKKGSDANPSRKDHEVLATDMVDLYNTVKPAGCNVHLWVSAQLTKTSDKQRFLSISDIGISKNSSDTASNVIMMRKVLDDEFDGGKKSIKCYKKVGNSTVPFYLQEGKKYQIIFLPKGRFKENDYQIVIENCLSTNTYKEIGYCFISPDW